MRNVIRKAILSHLPLVILLAPSSATADIKNIRMAHYLSGDIGDIPDSYMRYARSCGYNYLLAHGNDIGLSSGTDDWKNPATGARDGTYDFGWAKNNTSLYSKLKNLFERADRAGLKMIPVFNIGSRWAGHWSATNVNIQMNSGVEADGKSWNMPVFIPDPNGIDKSFQSYLQVVKEAFEDANLSYSQLDYIHIGHDEPVSTDQILFVGRWNTAEKVAIWSYGNNEAAYHRLFAEEIARRVTSVISTLPATKCIMWADIVDPEHNGGTTIAATFVQNINLPWSIGTYLNSITTMGILNRPEFTPTIKDNLLLAPWQYQTLFGHHLTGNDYDPQITFQYFKDRGFKVIVGTALDPIYTTLDDSRAMYREWVSVSNDPRFKDVIIGTTAHIFAEHHGNWETIPRPMQFQILPELAREVKFYPSMAPVYYLLNN